MKRLYSMFSKEFYRDPLGLVLGRGCDRMHVMHMRLAEATESGWLVAWQYAATDVKGTVSEQTHTHT